MALSYLLLESGDALLLEDGGYLLTEDTGPEERLGSVDVALDAVTAGASGALALKGSSATTLGAVLLSAAGALPGGGSVIVTLGPVSAGGTAKLGLQGSTSAGIGPIALDASGSITVAAGTGALSVNLAPITVVSGGELDLMGAANIVLANITLAASGAHGDMATGALSVTLDVIALAASATVVDPVSDGEPVSLIEARRQCSIDGEEHDGSLNHLRKAARSFVEAYTGLTLRARTIPLRFASWADIARLPVAPVSGVAIHYAAADGATATMDPADYDLFVDGYDSGIDLLVAAPALGKGRAPITVQVTAGFTTPTVPPHVKQAILLLIGQWFDNPSAVVNGPAVGEPPHTVAALLCNDRLFA